MNIAQSPMINISSMHKPKRSDISWHIPIWFVIIGLWSLWTIVTLLSVFYTTWSLYDYANYYHAAQRFNQGLAINLSIEAEVTYIYPPLLAHVLAPLEASLPFIETAVVWIVSNIGCLILSAFLLAGEIPFTRKRYIIWLLPILFIPTYETYLFGQVVPVILLLCVGGMIAYRHQHYVLVGLCLAIATWLKIYPIMIILYFVLRQEWRVVLWSFIAGMTLLFVQIGQSGADVMINYFSATLVELASKGQDFNLFNNHSLLGFLRKTLVDSSLVSIARTTITVGMVGIMVWVSTRHRYKPLSTLQPAQFEIEYSLVVVFMLLAGSTLHASGMLPLLLPIAMVIKYGQSHKIYSILFAIYLALGLTFFLVYKDVFGESSPLIQGFGFYTLFALWGLLVYMRWKANDRIQA